MSKLSRYNLLISLIHSELRCSHTINGVTMSTHNKMLCTDSVTSWLILSIDLMESCGLTEQASLTRLRNVIKIINTYDFTRITHTLKLAYEILINHISSKISLSSYSDFKGQFDENGSSIIGCLFSPIKEALSTVINDKTFVVNHCYKNTATRSMWVCAHYLLFLTKVNFTEVGLEEKALADYLIFESETASFDIDQARPYIRPIQLILKGWLKDWSYDGSLFRHGPGSVADSSRSKFSKYAALKTDEKLNYLYGPDLTQTQPVVCDVPLERTSRLVFVPKDITKLRSISMEPVSLQYYQQGCMKSLMDYFHTNLRSILNLSDQYQNQSFAYHGSITNDYATIDLSHASDSVNWRLTKELFKKVPKLMKWMVCTRSSSTLLPDGGTLLLEKFAPMGSSLCFPIESLIFASIAKLSILLSKEQGLDVNLETGIRSNTSRFTVYGDDIILPSYASKTCVFLLKIFGFTPNESKSYIDGPFKESCGGNFFCGFDITAIKFKACYDEAYPNNIGPEAYSALCSYANMAYDKQLHLLRLHCIHSIRKAGLKPLFSNDRNNSAAIFSTHATNFHLKVKYKGSKKLNKPNYQKYSYEYTGIKTVYNKRKVVDESIFLFDWFVNKRNNSTETVLTNGMVYNVHNSIMRPDVYLPYSRDTLLQNKVCFAMCECDTSHAYEINS